MVILGKLAYFAATSVGMQGHKLYQIDCLLDTGARTNSITEPFLTEHWTVHGQTAGRALLGFASKDSIECINKIDLHVNNVDYLTEATFTLLTSERSTFPPETVSPMRTSLAY